jgi:hypothetical protein
VTIILGLAIWIAASIVAGLFIAACMGFGMGSDDER